MKRFLLALALVAPAAADPRVFQPAQPPVGRIVLVDSREHETEAEALRRLGIACVLAAPATLESDLAWAREHLGGEWVVLGQGKTPPTLSNASGVIWLDAEAVPPASAVPLLVTGPGLQASGSVEVKAVPGGIEALARDDDPVQKAVRRFAVAHAKNAPVGLPGVQWVASPNWDVRSAGGPGIDTVVVHATVINTLEGTERAFLDDRVRRVSAHYVIDRDGTIVQMVDERCAAWHAGVSELDGQTGVNDFSLGIELVNLNDGKDPYPEAQMQSLVRVIRDLRTRWDVPEDRIVSHAFVARPEGRKSDPMGFDFQRLYQLIRE